MLARLKNIFPDLGDVIRRFPVAVAIMAVFTAIVIYAIDFRLDEQYARLLFGLAIGGYSAVMISLAQEVRGRPKLYLLQIIVAIILAVIFWFSEDLRLNLFMAGGAILLTLGNILSVGHARNDLKVWDFTHKLWAGAIMATVGSVIFTLGVMAITEALRSLLGINIRDLVQDIFLPIGLGFLAPLYWMSTLPPSTDYIDSYDMSADYAQPAFISKAIGFLGTWLLAPLCLIYAGILLLYGVKIGMAGELPKGEVAQLTLPFLLIGTLTWLVLEPPFIQKAALARWFRRLWFPLSIIVAVLLSIAVFIRIREYGYTEERFALVLAVIWSLGLGLIFTFKPKSDIRIIPMLGAGLLFLGMIIAQPFSISNQYHRVKSLTAELSLVNQAREITPIGAPTKQQKTELRSLKSSLSYLYKHRANKKLDRLFPGYGEKESQDDLWEALEVKNISTHRSRYTPMDQEQYDDRQAALNIADYALLYGPYKANIRDNATHSNVYLTQGHGGKAVTLTNDKGIIEMVFEDSRSAQVDIVTPIKSVQKPFPSPFIIAADQDIDVQIVDFSRGLGNDDNSFIQARFYILVKG